MDYRAVVFMGESFLSIDFAVGRGEIVHMVSLSGVEKKDYRLGIF